jgi:hypothetical protein
MFDPETPGPTSESKLLEGTGEPITGITPYANKEGDNEAFLNEKKRKKQTPLDKLTVETYLEKYTSEDNASFEELFKLHQNRERVSSKSLSIMLIANQLYRSKIHGCTKPKRNITKV